MSANDTPPVNACLHLLFSHSGDCVRVCLAQLGAGDSLVLLNTGVLLLLDPAWMHNLPEECTVYAIDADVQAHGLAEIQGSSGSVLIDDAAWARLVMMHAHCLSWK
ncbi:MAG TPA: DsrH/TusB family sulfur metabolism protein [Xanthomonadales bacterium]|nr:DsrH/TusB family sulfur metabolism protein [Xanthomonadales bacterium]